MRVQLLSWQRRRAQQGRDASSSLHRITPQCPAAPRHLVAKPVKDASAAALDPRGAFIAQHSGSMAIWKVSMRAFAFYHEYAGRNTFCHLHVALPSEAPIHHTQCCMSPYKTSTVMHKDWLPAGEVVPSQIPGGRAEECPTIHPL